MQEKKLSIMPRSVSVSWVSVSIITRTLFLLLPYVTLPQNHSVIGSHFFLTVTIHYLATENVLATKDTCRRIGSILCLWVFPSADALAVTHLAFISFTKEVGRELRQIFRMLNIYPKSDTMDKKTLSSKMQRENLKMKQLLQIVLSTINPKTSN